MDENVCASDPPFLRYLEARLDHARKFPEFGHDIHGVEPRADGTYQVMCLTDYD